MSALLVNGTIIKNVTVLDGGGSVSTDMVPLIPHMTSSNEPEGVVTCSTESDWNGYTHYAWKAFNGFANGEPDSWGVTGVGGADVNYVQYEFSEEIVPNIIYVRVPTAILMSGSGTLSVQFSEDGTEWETVHTCTASEAITNVFAYVENPKAYKYFKLEITGGIQSGSYIVIDEIQVYGTKK